MQTVDFNTIVSENAYINTMTLSATSVHSFRTLVTDRILTQSQNIILGNCMEPFFNDAVRKNKNWTDIRATILADEGKENQTDHMWLNEAKKTIVYGEQKNNLELDSEKAPATEAKIERITTNLKKKFPGYTIVPLLLASRYLSKDEALCKTASRRFTRTDVMGVNDYLALFNISPFLDYAEYKKIITAICVAKFGPPTVTSET